MATMSDPALRDVSIVIRAFEQVLRKLIRLFIGKISLRKIQEMVELIFVEEAEDKLKRENPSDNVALADLAILADVDTRSIKRIRSHIALSTPLHKDASFMNELIPEVSVLDVWESSEKYTDKQTGKPKTLQITGPGATFESLINEATSTNGVAVSSYLKRLTESMSIKILPGGNEVQLTETQYTSFALTDQSTSLKIGLAVVANLLDTITHNLLAPAQGDGAFYQRGCWTTRLSKTDREKLREMTKRFLSKSDKKARELIRPYEKEKACTEQITAGISMFYFEEERVA